MNEFLFLALSIGGASIFFFGLFLIYPPVAFLFAGALLMILSRGVTDAPITDNRERD